tara:strand:- start:102 stop:644 length:543 start_codon:yes stop_codon:yes gene_type:complete
MSDFIERQDDLLSKKECGDLINWSLSSRPVYKSPNSKYAGYGYANFNPNEVYDLVKLKPIKNSIDKLLTSYKENHPELNQISMWELEYLRIKWWKPGDYYSVWHSEHDVKTPLRVLSFLIYLSDNDSYTEFSRYGKFETKAGSGIMFPAYFTHTHRGSVCKRGLHRYIASGYFSFINSDT